MIGHLEEPLLSIRNSIVSESISAPLPWSRSHSGSGRGRLPVPLRRAFSFLPNGPWCTLPGRRGGCPGG